MLSKYLATLTGAAVLTGLGAILAQPSQAQSIQFSCEMNDGLPTTVARNVSTGASLPVVHWYSRYFNQSGYDPMTRCQQVSSRFQSARNSGRLDYITAGIVNGLPVVCATNAGGSCNNSNVLFTLKPGTNAASTLQRLFDVRDLGAGPLYESDGRPYINVDTLLAPLTSNAASDTPSESPSTVPTQMSEPTPATRPTGGW